MAGASDNDVPSIDHGMLSGQGESNGQLCLAVVYLDRRQHKVGV